MFHRVNLANNIDPDQMLQTVVSDLGTHCLPFSMLWANSADNNKLDGISYFSLQLSFGILLKLSQFACDSKTRAQLFKASLA